MSLTPGSSTHYGLPLNKDFSLVCSGEVTSSVPLIKLSLEDYVEVEWSDWRGSVNNMENSTISDVSLSGNLLRSTLNFHPLSQSHDKLYTCSMTIKHPIADVIPITDHSQYRVIFGKILNNSHY